MVANDLLLRRKRVREPTTTTKSGFEVETSASSTHNMDLYAAFVPPRRFLRKRKYLRPSTPSPTPPSPPILPRCTTTPSSSTMARRANDGMSPPPPPSWSSVASVCFLRDKMTCSQPRRMNHHKDKNPEEIMRGLLACMRQTEQSRTKLCKQRKTFSKEMLEMSDKVLYRNTTRRKLLSMLQEQLERGNFAPWHGPPPLGGKVAKEDDNDSFTSASESSEDDEDDDNSHRRGRTHHGRAFYSGPFSPPAVAAVSPYTSPEPCRPWVTPPPTGMVPPPTAIPRNTAAPRTPSSWSSQFFPSSPSYSPSQSVLRTNSRQVHSPQANRPSLSSHASSSTKHSPGRVSFASRHDDYDSPGRRSMDDSSSAGTNSTTNSPTRVSLASAHLSPQSTISSASRQRNKDNRPRAMTDVPRSIGLSS